METQLINVIPKGLIESIRFAIQNKRFMHINYNNKWTIAAGDRYVLPACLGTLKKGGRLVLRAYFSAGVSYSLATGTAKSSWRLYLLSKINFYQVTDNSFYARPVGYKMNDRSMSSIREQLMFSVEEIDASQLSEDDIIWESENIQ